MTSYLSVSLLMFPRLRGDSIISYRDTATTTSSIRIRPLHLVTVGLAGRCDLQRHV
jgi:hypothetical protein